MVDLIFQTRWVSGGGCAECEMNSPWVCLLNKYLKGVTTGLDHYSHYKRCQNIGVRNQKGDRTCRRVHLVPGKQGRGAGGRFLHAQTFCEPGTSLASIETKGKILFLPLMASMIS